MVEVRKYQLPPTALIPNSPQPLLHYPGFLSGDDISSEKVYDLFTGNGWGTQWIFEYGPTQHSHYHSGTHECMAVMSGTATIRFGVADTADDLEESTHGDGKEPGGVELSAKPGDVFVIPAGVAHKTYDTTEGSTFRLLTPGGAQKIEADDVRQTLADIKLEGFTMLGAYPNGSKWDFAMGTKDPSVRQKSWSVALPELDPVLGTDPSGLCGIWK